MNMTVDNKKVNKLKSYIKLMRVQHYIKNLLIFVPLVFGRKFFAGGNTAAMVLGFFSFCAISSSVYIVNDIKDREQDSKHTKKCRRPIASGAVSAKEGLALAIVLLVLAVSLSFLIRNGVSLLVALIILYFALNVLYSIHLKNVPIVDIVILASGFVIRVFYGSALGCVEISNWLYLTVVTISLFFALSKRRNELVHGDGAKIRKVLRFYNRGFLDKVMYMCLTLSLVFYALWSIDVNILRFRNAKYFVYTTPLILVIAMTYCLNIETKANGDPVDVLINSKPLLALSLIYALAIGLILYL